MPVPPRPPVAGKAKIPEFLDIPKYGAELLKKAGLPESKGRLIVGQGLTTGAQAFVTVVGEPLLNILFNGLTGLFFTVGSLFDIFPDNTTALAVGNQLLARAANVTVEEMKRAEENLSLLAEGLRTLDLDRIKSALLKKTDFLSFIKSLAPPQIVPEKKTLGMVEVIEEKPTATTTTVEKVEEVKPRVVRRFR